MKRCSILPDYQTHSDVYLLSIHPNLWKSVSLYIDNEPLFGKVFKHTQTWRKKTNVHTHIHIIKYVKCNHRMHKAKSLWEHHFWIIYNVNISDNWEIEFALLNSVRDTDQLQRWWLVMRTVKWEIWPFKYLHMFVLKRAPELELTNSVFADE